MTAGTTPPRKRDGNQRRRELCDAAIRVLAEHGSRGLTHAQVDRYAAVPEGTTSYYFRTRVALLRGAGYRVAEIDLANLQTVTDRTPDSRAPFAHLAELTLMQSDGTGLMLNRARHELLLNTARDPEIAGNATVLIDRMNGLARNAIAHLQPNTDDSELLDTQTTVITTYLAGVLARLAAGDRTINDPAELSRHLQVIAAAVAN